MFWRKPVLCHCMSSSIGILCKETSLMEGLFLYWFQKEVTLKNLSSLIAEPTSFVLEVLQVRRTLVCLRSVHTVRQRCRYQLDSTVSNGLVHTGAAVAAVPQVNGFQPYSMRQCMWQRLQQKPLRHCCRTVSTSLNFSFSWFIDVLMLYISGIICGSSFLSVCCSKELFH